LTTLGVHHTKFKVTNRNFPVKTVPFPPFFDLSEKIEHGRQIGPPSELVSFFSPLSFLFSSFIFVFFFDIRSSLYTPAMRTGFPAFSDIVPEGVYFPLPLSISFLSGRSVFSFFLTVALYDFKNPVEGSNFYQSLSSSLPPLFLGLATMNSRSFK